MPSTKLAGWPLFNASSMKPSSLQGTPKSNLNSTMSVLPPILLMVRGRCDAQNARVLWNANGVLLKSFRKLGAHCKWWRGWKVLSLHMAPFGHEGKGLPGLLHAVGSGFLVRVAWQRFQGSLVGALNDTRNDCGPLFAQL